MVDTKTYQSNIITDSPETQAKKKAIEEAYIPESLKSFFVQSSASEPKSKDIENSCSPNSEQKSQ